MDIEKRIKHYWEHRDLTAHDFNCADPGGCQFIEMLLKKLKEYEEWANNVANDERVCNWIHKEDYSLYTMLASPPEIFDVLQTGETK